MHSSKCAPTAAVAPGRGSVQGASVWGWGLWGSVSGRSLCTGGSLFKGCLSVGGSLSERVSVWEVSVQGDVSVWGGSPSKGCL